MFLHNNDLVTEYELEDTAVVVITTLTTCNNLVVFKRPDVLPTV